jgi:hypothetical protein
MSEKDKSLFTEKHPDGYSISLAAASKKTWPVEATQEAVIVRAINWTRSQQALK